MVTAELPVLTCNATPSRCIGARCSASMQQHNAHREPHHEAVAACCPVEGEVRVLRPHVDDVKTVLVAIQLLEACLDGLGTGAVSTSRVAHQHQNAFPAAVGCSAAAAGFVKWPQLRCVRMPTATMLHSKGVIMTAEICNSQPCPAFHARLMHVRACVLPQRASASQHHFMHMIVSVNSASQSAAVSRSLHSYAVNAERTSKPDPAPMDSAARLNRGMPPMMPLPEKRGPLLVLDPSEPLCAAD